MLTITTEPFFDGREMFMVHRMFRREFGLMPGLVREVAAGDKERTGIVVAHIASIAGTLHLHHRTEDDQVWPLLLERGPEDVAPVVRLMETQHANLEDLTSEVDAALDAWRGTATAASRDALADVLRLLASALGDHMRLEEERAVPLMEKYVTAAEWNEIIQPEIADVDPESLVLALGMVMYEGDPDIIEAVIANMPPEVRPVIGQLATDAFAVHSERVHGTATPPRSTEL